MSDIAVMGGGRSTAFGGCGDVGDQRSFVGRSLVCSVYIYAA